MEVTRASFEPLKQLMDLVDLIAATAGVEHVELSVTLDGQRYDIGFGEQAEAAILGCYAPRPTG